MSASRRFSAGAACRALILVLGLVVPQAVLFWPSLTGQKILLPLDILTQPGAYIPRDAHTKVEPPQDPIFSDLIFIFELNRRFAVSEVRAGRVPLWNPYNYLGAPFMATNHPAVFSPLRVLDYIWPGTRTIAWTQLVKSVIAGVGAYLFARAVLRAWFLPAAIGAWCWPLTGFMILWQGYSLSAMAALLPWTLLATHAAVRRPWGLGMVGLSLTTALLMVSGHAANAGHVLIASGLFALWSVFMLRDEEGTSRPSAARSLGSVVVGWTLGFLLAAPQLLPTLEYMQDSWRLALRSAGLVETPAVGASALVQMVLPFIHGSTHRSTVYTVQGNLLESPAAAYAGLIVALVLAPLAFSQKHMRWVAIFWVVLAFVGMTQVLGVPLLEKVFEIPPLDILRNNRFVLVTAWSAIALGVLGLEALRDQEWSWRPWHWIFVAGFACAAVLFFVKSAGSPTEIGKELRAATSVLSPAPLADPALIEPVGRWFQRLYFWIGCLCVAGLALWLVLKNRNLRLRWFLPLAGLIALVELVATAHGTNPQCDPSLDYPRVEALERLAKAPYGRICGVDCLPPSLNQTHGLRDMRGYDAVDPARVIELYALFKSPTALPSPHYAVTTNFVPRAPSPLCDMLGVRYLLVPGPPEATSRPMFQVPGYWVWQNPKAFPRVWVPRRAVVENDKARRLAILGDARFDAREVVVLESEEPVSIAAAAGEARIVAETPLEIDIELSMRTAGVVVLSDLWTNGWKAWVDGKETPVLPANHALRGVVVPAGASRLKMRYEPRSFTIGLWLAGVSALAMIGAVIARPRTGCAPEANPST